MIKKGDNMARIEGSGPGYGNIGKNIADTDDSSRVSATEINKLRNHKQDLLNKITTSEFTKAIQTLNVWYYVDPHTIPADVTNKDPVLPVGMFWPVRDGLNKFFTWNPQTPEADAIKCYNTQIENLKFAITNIHAFDIRVQGRISALEHEIDSITSMISDIQQTGFYHINYNDPVLSTRIDHLKETIQHLDDAF